LSHGTARPSALGEVVLAAYMIDSIYEGMELHVDLG
jgi:hypothetical protein